MGPSHIAKKVDATVCLHLLMPRCWTLRFELKELGRLSFKERYTSGACSYSLVCVGDLMSQRDSVNCKILFRVLQPWV